MDAAGSLKLRFVPPDCCFQNIRTNLIRMPVRLQLDHFSDNSLIISACKPDGHFSFH
ncbi:hypothetical protein HMPREF1548_06991 [Clostridium sp. KLE 1755]|nr:hypothetical protein HMPREF1548_06991 [Clostridium sp. KLE 1755]